MSSRDTDERNKELRIKAVQAAQAIITEELTILAGCRRLARIGAHLLDDWKGDKDFLVIGVLADDTDYLPLEDQRHNWDSDAYCKKQLEVSEIENSAREKVINACRSIVARFGGV